jgi:hypothetical protein
VPNRKTRDLRETIATVVNDNAPKVQGWIDRVALKNPARAVELVMECAAFVLPKLRSVEIKTDPQAPPPQFNISFALGGPGNPLSAEEATKAAKALPANHFDHIEVSGDVELSSDTGEPDESPLALPPATPERSLSPMAVEPPRVAPDPRNPNAVVIDADSGAVWASLLAASAGMPEPSETRAASARRQESLDRRKREHAEWNEQERQRQLGAARIRKQKMGDI